MFRKAGWTGYSVPKCLEQLAKRDQKDPKRYSGNGSPWAVSKWKKLPDQVQKAVALAVATGDQKNGGAFFAGRWGVDFGGACP